MIMGEKCVWMSSDHRSIEAPRYHPASLFVCKKYTPTEVYHDEMSKNTVDTLGQALGACLGSLAALLSADHDLVGGQSRSSALAIHTVVDSPGTFLYL